MSDLVIKAKNVNRDFGQLRAINNLELSVEKGQIYGFLGPNGCGKTTVIRLLTGLLKPTSGSIEVLGHSLPGSAEKLRMRTGYMTQNFSLFDDLTVFENLNFVAKVFGLAKSQQRNRIDELLSIYGLSTMTNQLSGSMSGGQKQRLSLAAATIHQPELLFLDEPTSAVDPENRRDFWEKLFDLSDRGTSIIVSTHYMDEAERCHKLAILETGCKRVDGTPTQLMDDMRANVVEISANNLRALKQTLTELPDVISAAQLGVQLRVIIKDSVSNPIDFILNQQLNGLAISKKQMHIVRPSLEDVFVTCTGNGP